MLNLIVKQGLGPCIDRAQGPPVWIFASIGCVSVVGRCECANLCYYVDVCVGTVVPKNMLL